MNSTAIRCCARDRLFFVRVWVMRSGFAGKLEAADCRHRPPSCRLLLWLEPGAHCSLDVGGQLLWRDLAFHSVDDLSLQYRGGGWRLPAETDQGEIGRGVF